MSTNTQGDMMIIKEISTQGTDDDGNPLYLFRDSEEYTEEEWKQLVKYLKVNKKAGLLNFEIVEVAETD